MRLQFTMLLIVGLAVPSVGAGLDFSRDRGHMGGVGLSPILLPVTAIARAAECIAPTRVDDLKNGKLTFQALDAKRLEAINKADVVFSGKVISRQDLKASRQSAGIRYPRMVRWTFAVDGIAKGNPSKVQQVISPRTNSPQQFSFKVGGRYQVHAKQASGALMTNNCAGNEELSATGNPFPVVDGRQAIPKRNAPIRYPDNSRLPADKLISRSQILARLKLTPDARLLSLELMRFGDYEKRDDGGSRLHEVAEGRQVWVLKTFYTLYNHNRMGRVKNATVTSVMDAQTGRGFIHGFSGCPLDNFGPRAIFDNNPQVGQLTKEEILTLAALPANAKIQEVWLSSDNTTARQGSYQVIEANQAVWTIEAIYPEYQDNKRGQIKDAKVLMVFDAKSGQLLDKTVDCQQVGGNES